jgi:hypothetical protein
MVHDAMHLAGNRTFPEGLIPAIKAKGTQRQGGTGPGDGEQMPWLPEFVSSALKTLPGEEKIDV